MFATHLWGLTTLIALVFTLPGWSQEPPTQLQPAKVRVDLHGDPLPQGVTARLGTVRLPPCRDRSCGGIFRGRQAPGRFQ